MARGGFSWKRTLGVSKAKAKISRETGIPLTKEGRRRKIAKASGCGIWACLACLLVFGVMFLGCRASTTVCRDVVGHLDPVKTVCLPMQEMQGSRLVGQAPKDVSEASVTTAHMDSL